VALHQLAARQRALLILREALGFSAQEVAKTLRLVRSLVSSRSTPSPRACSSCDPASAAAMARRSLVAQGRSDPAGSREQGPALRAAQCVSGESRGRGE
jgi:hypothetical protein